jgi:hypothetical protein
MTHFCLFFGSFCLFLGQNDPFWGLRTPKTLIFGKKPPFSATFMKKRGFWQLLSHCFFRKITFPGGVPGFEAKIGEKVEK